MIENVICLLALLAPLLALLVLLAPLLALAPVSALQPSCSLLL